MAVLTHARRLSI